MNNSVIRIISAVFLSVVCACGSSSSSHNNGNPNISVTPEAHDFGGVTINKVTDCTFTVKNTGTGSLDIGQVTVAGEGFSLNSGNDNCSGTSLGPSETCNLLVLFSPEKQGLFNAGTLTVPSNVTTKTMSLSGEGYGLNVWINSITGNCVKISIDVTVFDPANMTSLVNLNEDNFAVNQDGQSQSFSLEGNVSDAVSAVVALDLSDSMTAAIPNIRAAASSFIDSLKDEDEAAICKFKNEIILYPDTGFESDKSILKAYINTFPDPEEDGTLLFDALYKSIERLATEKTPNNKPAVILLSDGADYPANVPEDNTLASVITYAKARGIPIFTIFYVDGSYSEDANPQLLQRLSNETGGQYYNSVNYTNLNNVFEQISIILSNKYTLTYTPAVCSSGSTMNIDVIVDDAGKHGQDSRTYIVPVK